MASKIQFGVYELDREAAELRKHGVLIRLQEQPLQVLTALVERPGEIVTREALQERIWGKDTFVDFDQSLNKAVNRLREALCDEAAQPRYIETVPRRGYRFVAPVTGIPRTEANVSTQQMSAGLAGKPAKSGFHGPPWIGTGAVLIAAGALVAGVFAVSWLKRPEKPTSWEARRMTSAGFGPALSRDGKLLAFVSAVGGDVQHIWLEQTAGGEAIPVTKGADTDFPPVDFSPDGTHIAFASTRGGGGLYIAPTLTGEPRLLVSSPEAGSPRFSPGGQEILYFEDHKLFKVSVDGGQPVALTLNQDFLVDYPPPLWAPSGNEIIFYGVSRREPDKPNSWRIAPLTGGEPRLVRLPGVERDKGSPWVRAWTRTKDGREWIVYSASTGDTWKLLCIETSKLGDVEAEPKQLTSGTGALGFGGSFSEDGKIAYTTVTSSSSIYEIPTNDRGAKVGPTLQLPFSEERDDRFPSVSRDGRWMVYNTSGPTKPNIVLLRDLGSGIDRVLDDRGNHRPHGGNTSISPDGSRIIFERECKSGRYQGEGMELCAFIESAAGGEPEKICERCAARGFSTDGSVVLIQKYDLIGSERHDKIAALDLATKAEKDFLSLPDTGRHHVPFASGLWHAFFSWDDHWVVFKKQLFTKAQIMIAPVRRGVAGKESDWIAVTDGRYSDDKPQFSPDGNTVYFTSTRDGYLCIWAQRLDPATKRPVGTPVAFEHFHNSMGRDAVGRDAANFGTGQADCDLTVARDKILINLPQVRSDIWMTQMQ